MFPKPREPSTFELAIPNILTRYHRHLSCFFKIYAYFNFTKDVRGR